MADILLRAHIDLCMKLPQEVIPLGIVYLGYPAEEKELRTQYDEKLVYWQQYEDRKHRTRKKNTQFES